MIESKIMNSKKSTKIWIVTMLLAVSMMLMYTTYSSASIESGIANTSIMESTTPDVYLVYPSNSSTLESGEIVLYFNVSDRQWSNITNCTLILNGSINATKTDVNYTTSQFVLQDNITKNFTLSSLAPGEYEWSVNCTEARDPRYDDTSSSETGSSQTYKLTITTKTQEIENISISVSGTDARLNWSAVSAATLYKIYYANSISSAFTHMANTSDTKYTDRTANSSITRYYKISAYNALGENMTNETYGKITYQLMRKEGYNTRNWLSFPLNDSSLRNAKALLNNITNATSVVMWNSTTQMARSCNLYSCPTIGCTATNCNFTIVPGSGYEVNINESAPLAVNWTMAGKVIRPKSVKVYSISGTFSRNWISIPSNTTITNAQGIITSMNQISAVRNWNPETQSTESRIKISPVFGIGTNFNTYSYKGYDVLAQGNFTWVQ